MKNGKIWISSLRKSHPSPPHQQPKRQQNTHKADTRPETYLLSTSCKVKAHLSSPPKINCPSFLKVCSLLGRGKTPSGSQLQAVTLYNLFCRTSFDHHELATARKCRRGRKREKERGREREGAELSAREEEEKMYVWQIMLPRNNTSLSLGLGLSES